MKPTPDPTQPDREQAASESVRRRLAALFLDHFVLANETTYFILVNALDFFVTYLLLYLPGSTGYEANPIARMLFHWNIKYLIAFKFGMVTIAAVCCEITARRSPRFGRLALISLTLVVAAVVIYGLRLLLGQIG